MFWVNERITEDQANEIVSICIERATLKGVDFTRCTPAGVSKDYLETLMFFDGVWFIQYNDENGSTRVARWDT